MEKLEIGQQIETEIVAIGIDTIFLDLNAKSEGVLSRAELADENGNLSVKEGDKIKVFFLGYKTTRPALLQKSADRAPTIQ